MNVENPPGRGPCSLPLAYLAWMLVSATAVAQPAADPSQLPAAFVPNRGQWSHSAPYVACLGPVTVFLERDGWLATFTDRGAQRAAGVRMRFVGGDKISCRKMAKASKTPIFPGSESAIEDEDEASELAAKIGYPVIVKAAAGGGGRGMRIVTRRAR